MHLQRVVTLILFYLLTSVSSAYADTLSTQDKTKQVWQLLDYLAVDYGRSVKDGQVANADEYAEMQEFAHAAQRQIAAVSYTHLTLPTNTVTCRSRWSPYH